MLFLFIFSLLVLEENIGFPYDDYQEDDQSYVDITCYLVIAQSDQYGRRCKCDIDDIYDQNGDPSRKLHLEQLMMEVFFVWCSNRFAFQKSSQYCEKRIEYRNCQNYDRHDQAVECNIFES